MNERNSLEKLTDNELIDKLLALHLKEHLGTLEVLACLAEVDDRKLFVEHGCPSMFSHCVSKLRYSESAANRRIRCARVIRAYPDTLDYLKRKDINLSTLSLVASIFTEENYEEILQKIFRKSQREVEMVVAEYRPRKQVRERIKPVVIVQKLSTNAVQGIPTKSFCNRSGGSSVGEELGLFSVAAAECQQQTTAEQRYQLTFSASTRSSKRNLKKCRCFSPARILVALRWRKPSRRSYVTI